MSKILFTDTQVKKLNKNKWIKNITNKGITYTDEFKYKLVKELKITKSFLKMSLENVVLILKQLELIEYSVQHIDGENN